MNRMGLSSSDIEGTLIEDIRCGAIDVGDPLPTERALCDRFGASRPTIREAPFGLQIRGFFSRAAAHRPRTELPTRGGFLKFVGDELRRTLADLKQTAHLEKLRQFLEAGATRLAARHASDADVATIHDALIRCHAVRIDDKEFSRADVGFHRTIVATARNSILLDLHDRFVLDVVNARKATPDNKASYDEHTQIFEAIARRDAEAAVAAMEQNLGRTFRETLTAPGRA